MEKNLSRTAKNNKQRKHQVKQLLWYSYIIKQNLKIYFKNKKDGFNKPSFS